MKLIFIMLLLAISCLLAAQTNNVNLEELSGSFKSLKDGNELRLDTADGKSYRLVLAPKAALDSLGLSDSVLKGNISIKGKSNASIFVAHQVIIADTTYTLRDSEGKPLWNQLSTTAVKASACIGCRMCPSQCPVNAIKMLKGKAVIDATICAECGICQTGNERWRGCPVGAIETK